jgi:hypothetical protein
MHMHGVVHVRGACVLQRIAPLRCPCGAPAVPLRCPCGAPAIPLRPVGRCAVRRVLALQRQRSMCTAHTLPTQECPRTTHVLHVRTCVGCLILSAMRRNMHLRVWSAAESTTATGPHGLTAASD